MKGIYLCAFYANHPQADLDYQDKFIETIGDFSHDQ